MRFPTPLLMTILSQHYTKITMKQKRTQHSKINNLRETFVIIFQKSLEIEIQKLKTSGKKNFKENSLNAEKIYKKGQNED